MEEAFLESVNRFDLCNLASSSGEQVGEESEQDLAAGGAVANTMLEGTEEEESGSESPPLPPTQSGTGVMEERDGRVAKQDKGVRFWRQKENGKIPEDIPSADNDDVVAEQIRLAATIEKDADKKRKLWNEYRRYQGLPIKEDAE
ncbi:hypothetical protein SPBRAN_1188 [uncultured Candidatus Thioglobus sp.]|nr:hypothetical protein SPBRAN_1188 [uncultured Candidatus Thioglobus sp.]